MRLSTLRHRLTNKLLVAGILIVLAGCGFQPRGQVQGVSGIPSPLHVSGIRTYSALHRELKKQLEQVGVSVAANAAGSAAVLHIRKHDSDRRVLSVDSRNKTVENELEESARFELRSPDRQEVLATEQTARVLRIQFAPRETVLGNRREEDLLRQDMRRELAQRILQRIAARH